MSIVRCIIKLEVDDEKLKRLGYECVDDYLNECDFCVFDVAHDDICVDAEAFQIEDEQIEDEQKGETKMSKEFEVIEEMQLATMDVRIIKIDGKYYWQQWDKLEEAYIPYIDDLIGMNDGFDAYEEVVDDAQGTDDNQVLWDLGSH